MNKIEQVWAEWESIQDLLQTVGIDLYEAAKAAVKLLRKDPKFV